MGSQPPFRPEELAPPPMEGAAFLRFLQDEKERRYPDPPPFLQALYDGKLNQDDLRVWAKDLYAYWNDGLVYSTGAIYIKTNDEPVRTEMLRRMVDVEGKVLAEDLTGKTTPAYEELWLRFAEGLGLDRAEVTSWQTFTRTHHSIRTLCSYSRYWDWSWLDGVATWYAADLHWRAYYTKAHEALKDKYSLGDGALEFFTVMLGDVDTHIPWEEEGLVYWACTTERQLTAARAFRERLDIENQLLVAVEEARTGSRTPFQVPI